MFIYVLDQVFDVYVMVEITWRSVGNSVFPLLFCMEQVILMEEVILNDIIHIRYS